jgi:Uncharacterized protein conserved in bacteria (DUF2330)
MLPVSGRNCRNYLHLAVLLYMRLEYKTGVLFPLQLLRGSHVMRPTRMLTIVGLLAACPLPVLLPSFVKACGVAAREGVNVAIAEESAIIIWDPATKTQHFIRRASFKTEAQDFGFLVPTPTKPDLGEANEMAFKRLLPYALPQPKGKKAGGGGKPPAVEVLDEKLVAGQDVVVLKATDADALAKWLTDHGYAFAPELKDWVKPYIEAKWVITASKIAKDRDGLAVKNVDSKAVRMSFKTDSPFYPYRELAEKEGKKAGQADRMLRVFFISNTKYQGTIGDRGHARPWSAQVIRDTKFTPKVPPKVTTKATLRDSLLKELDLPLETLPGDWHITVFEDRSVVRPEGGDVYFSPAANPEPAEKKGQVQR